jgi:hypothetical protein
VLNYCHSDGKPLGAANATHADLDEHRNMGCSSCHRAGTLATGARHARAYGVGCRTCHHDGMAARPSSRAAAGT